MSDTTPPVAAAAPAADKPEEPKAQTFNLKVIETQLLATVQFNQQSVFSAILSVIAQDRLGYNVTNQTQFKLNPEMSQIEISELPTPPVPVNPAPDADAAAPAEAPKPPETPPAAPSSGAVAAS